MTVATAPDAPTLESTIKRMAALPERQFRAIVDRDLRRREAEADGDTPLDEIESRALRSAALVDRWLTALLAASKSVEGQLSARKMDYDATKAQLRRQIERLEHKETHGGLTDQEDAELREARDKMLAAKERYSRSRSGTLRFKSGLDEWIVEARGIRDGFRDRLYDTVVVEERNRLAQRVRVLEDGIRVHRDTFPDDDEPTDADEELWALIG
jgi:hypothetical protein